MNKRVVKSDLFEAMHKGHEAEAPVQKDAPTNRMVKPVDINPRPEPKRPVTGHEEIHHAPPVKDHDTFMVKILVVLIAAAVLFVLGIHFGSKDEAVPATPSTLAEGPQPNTPATNLVHSSQPVQETKVVTPPPPPVEPEALNLGKYTILLCSGIPRENSIREIQEDLEKNSPYGHIRVTKESSGWAIYSGNFHSTKSETAKKALDYFQNYKFQKKRNFKDAGFRKYKKP